MGRRSLDKQQLLLVLLALLSEREHTAGTVLDELRRRLGSSYFVSGGRVFIALDALEAEGLLSVGSDAERPVYRPTAEGTAALRERAHSPILAAIGTRGEREAAASESELEQVAVLFTDVVASSALFDQHDAAEAHAMLSRHFTLLRAAAGEHAGRVIKTLGDGIMVVFGGAGSAVECALAMQRAVAGSHDPLELRVGISFGEAVCDEGDYFGRPVIVARRLCDAARPGDVLVADAARRLVPAAQEHEATPVQHLQLKGLSEPVAASALRVA